MAAKNDFLTDAIVTLFFLDIKYKKRCKETYHSENLYEKKENVC